MRDLAENDSVASLTIKELEMLIEHIIERRQDVSLAKNDEPYIPTRIDRTEAQIKAIRALRVSGRGERLVTRLWAARAEERDRGA